MNAKKTIVSVLGGSKTVWSTPRTGDVLITRCATADSSAAKDAKATGEARVVAALPEVANERPAAVLYFTPYAFVRDELLPIMEKNVPKKDAEQYQAMAAALTPAEPNSALAIGVWTDPDGSMRSLLRITASELKNLGAAFNAFTASSLVGAEND